MTPVGADPGKNIKNATCRIKSTPLLEQDFLIG